MAQKRQSDEKLASNLYMTLQSPATKTGSTDDYPSKEGGNELNQ